MKTTTITQDHLNAVQSVVVQAALQACGVETDAVGQDSTSYFVPDSPFRDWRGEELPTFVPDRRQQIIMDAVAKALDAGLFYNVDVNARVAATLQLSAEVIARNTTRTEGGNFGSDVYMARKAVEAQRKHAQRRLVAGELRLAVGDKLGALVFSDFKRNTSAMVATVSDDGMAMTITAKRGSVGVQIKPCPLQLKGAIERAHERGNRKDSYQEFVAARQQTQFCTASEQGA